LHFIFFYLFIFLFRFHECLLMLQARCLPPALTDALPAAGDLRFQLLTFTDRSAGTVDDKPRTAAIITGAKSAGICIRP
jgi:hypothetical protein